MLILLNILQYMPFFQLKPPGSIDVPIPDTVHMTSVPCPVGDLTGNTYC